MTRRLAALAPILAACVFPAISSATITWKTPATPYVDGGAAATISGSVLRAAVMDPSGDAVAIGGKGGGFSNDLTFVISRPAAGAFSSAQQLLAATFTHSEPIGLGIDDAGNAHAFTFDTDATIPADNRLHEWVLAAGTTTWSPVLISSEVPDSSSTTWAAVAGSGVEVALWRTGTNPNFQLRFATRSPGGAWTAPANVTGASGNIVADQVAIDSAGDIVVAYRNVGTHQAFAAFKPGSSSTWDAHAVSTTTGTLDVQDVNVGLDDAGDATAVWERQVTGGNWLPEVATRPFATATWSGASALEASSQASAPFPHLAVDRAGAAAVAWAGASNPMATTRSGPAAAFDSPNTFSAMTVDPVNVAIDAQGTAAVLWVNGSGVLQGARHPLGGAWSALPDGPSSLSSSVPMLGVDGVGDGLAVVVDSSLEFVDALGLDAAGPLLTSATFPATGTVGTPVAFSVAPVDVWSSVATAGWDFGDGTSASAVTSGSHTYATAATFTPTVSATDSVGNTSTRQFSIAVASTGTGAGTQTGTTPTTTTPTTATPHAPTVALPGLVLIARTTGKGTARASCAAPAGDFCSVSGVLKFAGSLTSRVKKVKIGSFAGQIGGGQRGTITFKLTKPGLKLLRRKRSLKVSASGKSRNRAGQSVAVSKAIRLRLKKK